MTTSDDNKSNRFLFFNSNFYLLYTNIRSISNKLDYLYYLIRSKKYKILLFSETWLGEKIDNQLLTLNSNYKCIRSDRHSHGGGVLALISTPFIFIDSIFKFNVNLICFDILLHNTTKIRLLLIYIPPNANKTPDQMKKITNLILNYVDTDYPLLICGDFNLHINWNTNTYTTPAERDFYVFIYGLNLTQLINVPTRKNKILDLLFTSIPNHITNLHILPPIKSSDHNTIVFSISIPKATKPFLNKSVIFDFKRGDYKGLNNYLCNTNWKQIFGNIIDIDIMYNNFSQVVTTGMEKFIPKTKSATSKINYPSHIQKLQAYQNKLFKNIQYPCVETKYKYISKDLNNRITKFHNYLEKKMLNKSTKHYSNMLIII